MRIGCIGAGGTGKTTTINAASKKGIYLPILPSASRIVYARRQLTEADQYKMTPDKTYGLQMEIFKERFELEKTHDNFISDRTLIDNLAYVLLWNSKLISKEDYKNLEVIVMKSLETYDALFYFPISAFLQKDDDLRINNYGHSVIIDVILNGLIDKFYKIINPKLTILQSGDLEFRSSTIYQTYQRLVGEQYERYIEQAGN